MHPYNDSMDIILMILAATIVLGFLVFIHEGGHFLAARAFGVRVSEFMIGLPGPRMGIQRGETTFGITCIPLGGYARVCGMEPGNMSSYLEMVMASVYARGTVLLEDVMADCNLSEEDAITALDELVEWGTITGPKRKDKFNVYRVPAFKPTFLQRKRAAKKGVELCSARKEGEPHRLSNPAAFFESEYRQQYRSLPAWKRMVILLAGPGVNLIFAIFAIVLIYSVIGIDVQLSDGSLTHITIGPLQALQAGFNYIGMVIQAVIGLFNPQTAAETVSNSTSIVGIAVMSKSALEAGFTNALMFTAMLSVSLGIMNLLPIPPLDGGRFVVEVYQRIRRKAVSIKAMNYLSLAGMALFGLFFIVMMNQDIQRFIFGNWS